MIHRTAWAERRVRVPERRDVVLAAALCAAVLVGTAAVVVCRFGGAGGPYPAAAAAVLVLLAAAAWCWHRSAPVGSTVVVVAAVSGYVLAGLPYGPVLLLVALACWALARHRPARVVVPTCVLAGGALAAALSTRLAATDPIATAAILLAWPAVFVVVPALAGALVRVRADAAARERAALLARGAFEERLRVAREVHDIAGHGFAVVAMQAGVALTVLAEDPDQARASLEAIRTSSERALGELQATLDTVRADPPGGAELPELVDRVGAGGLPVALSVTGDAAGLAPEVSATVYRVVQEALTNVLRHAGPTTAEVAVVYGPEEVAVAVRDRGRGATAGPGGGLRGLRERVEHLHGRFAAADRPGGGYQLSVTIPARGVPR